MARYISRKITCIWNAGLLFQFMCALYIDPTNKFQLSYILLTYIDGA
jgi:hypothetical protein